ncbi:uncharacterized protein ATNIH1004_009437 [Aspergillus tanneri]|uniref:Uncharacterized protein n=1 Tax=Aspergillus tanneri TaxID=1220188 RepID=A0A5M9M6N0_9EURO|nr:uncharacterized protein ATNIH1004_009437 [Aspergillus tanneri]KAA8642685.1 hypothetical protein ATNIH1004_009437 [Aspergillus tanneri]
MDEDQWMEAIVDEQATHSPHGGHDIRPGYHGAPWDHRPPPGHVSLTSAPVVVFIRERIQRVSTGKVIIYANVVRQVVDIAQELQCEAYYSRQIDKPSILQRFTQGQTRCIIHVGMPRSLLDYTQESGCAGRDGEASEAIIIQPEGSQHPGLDTSPTIPHWWRNIWITVDRYQRQYCQDQNPEEVPCDGCHPDWHSVSIVKAEGSMVDLVIIESPPLSHPNYIRSSPGGGSDSPTYSPPSIKIDYPSSSNASPASFQSQPPWIDVAEQQRQRIQVQRQAAVDSQQRTQDAQQWLDKEFIKSQAPQWQRQCYICTVQGHAWNKHDLYSCRGPASQTAKQWMVEIRQKIRYAQFSACFRCGMPQSICNRWQVGSQATCAYHDVLIPITAAMVYGPWAEQV